MMIYVGGMSAVCNPRPMRNSSTEYARDSTVTSNAARGGEGLFKGSHVPLFYARDASPGDHSVSLLDLHN